LVEKFAVVPCLEWTQHCWLACWSVGLCSRGYHASDCCRFAIVEVATTIEQETAFAEGIKVFEAWEDWMQDMLLTAPDGMVCACPIA